jgi:hypothetical protein
MALSVSRIFDPCHANKPLRLAVLVSRPPGYEEHLCKVGWPHTPIACGCSRSTVLLARGHRQVHNQRGHVLKGFFEKS